VEEIGDRMPESAPGAVFETHVLENAEGKMRTAVRINERKKK
jgi:hypothetical protein